MAIQLKVGKTIEDKFGNIYEDAIGVIDQCNGNKKQKLQYIVLEIYKDTEARLTKQPILQFNYTLRGEEFDSWYGVNSLIDSNQYKQGYLYLLQLRTIIGKDEETGEDILSEPVWGDWESDEL